MNNLMLILRHVSRLLLLKQPSVAAQLSTKILMDQEKHRNLLLKQLDSLQYLTCQGLAVQGHGDEDGNQLEPMTLPACSNG